LRSPRLLAVVEGLLVAAIWASSFVFIKMGLSYIEPITLAGLRYFTAFVLLLPLLAFRGELRCRLTRREWAQLIIMGLCAYTLANGALFWGLTHLPSVTGSFLFSLIPLPVLLLGIVWLKEIPRGWQVVGVMVALGGSLLFFAPGLTAKQPLAVGVVSFGAFCFGCYGVLSRDLAKEARLSVVQLAAFPLGFGGGVLLIWGLLVEGVPTLSLPGVLVTLWLAVVNTACAYLLFYHALRVLKAFEFYVFLNLAPLGTAGLGYLLLGERLALIQIVGILTAIVGVSLVQRRK
jgi:drug/metabolite transporter (DMT)-like permease